MTFHPDTDPGEDFDGPRDEATCNPDVFFDEPPQPEVSQTEIPDGARLMAARFLTFVRWAGNDAARLAIVAALLNIDDRPQAQIAREHRISEDKINRAMRDGKAFLREVQASQSTT